MATARNSPPRASTCGAQNVLHRRTPWMNIIGWCIRRTRGEDVGGGGPKAGATSTGGALSTTVRRFSTANRAACVRLVRASLARMFDTCVRAVLSAIPSSSAMARFVSPRATPSRTSRSRVVSRPKPARAASLADVEPGP